MCIILSLPASWEKYLKQIIIYNFFFNQQLDFKKVIFNSDLLNRFSATVRRSRSPDTKHSDRCAQDFVNPKNVQVCKLNTTSTKAHFHTQHHKSVLSLTATTAKAVDCLHESRCLLMQMSTSHAATSLPTSPLAEHTNFHLDGLQLCAKRISRQLHILCVTV